MGSFLDLWAVFEKKMQFTDGLICWKVAAHSGTNRAEMSRGMTWNQSRPSSLEFSVSLFQFYRSLLLDRPENNKQEAGKAAIKLVLLWRVLKLGNLFYLYTEQLWFIWIQLIQYSDYIPLQIA